MKDIIECVLVPFFQVFLEEFEFLLKDVHFGPPLDLQFSPPNLNRIQEIKMRKPKIFKLERETSRESIIIPSYPNWLMVRTHER